MVCSLGNGKMAVMARLLAEGSLSHIPSGKEKNGDVSKQKLAFQCIYRELREADSPNLLDEEDMHVFGLTPMTDPLHLVCCNACRKPVKASQYAVHAGEMLLQPSGGIGHRKPPRKDKKKSLSSFSNQAAPAGEQEQFESIDVDDSAALKSHFDGRSKLRSSFSLDTKRNSACVGVTSMMDGKGVNHENTNPSACVISPPTKRSKLVLNQNLSQPDDLEISSYLAGIESSQVFDPCRELHKQGASESDLCNGAVFVKSSQQAYESCQMARDVPVPIATKIYYSQRNNHLRSAIGNLYHTVSAKGPSDGLTCPEVSQEIKKEFQGHRGVSNDQKQDMLNKKRHPPMSKPDQILVQISNVGVDKPGGCLPSANFSSHLPVDNILRPQTATVRLLQSKYLYDNPYSFAENSGKSPQTIQRPNDSVPVL